MSHLMSQELGQAIINYLGTQPYAQVSQMIAGMQQMSEIDDEKLGAFIAAQQASADNVTPLKPEAKKSKDKKDAD